MTPRITVVSVPQLGVNDPNASITAWHVRTGDSVQVGDRLCSLETTKAEFDVEAEVAGYVRLLVEGEVDVQVSEPIALIGDDLVALEDRIRQYKSDHHAAQPITNRATRKAVEAAERLGIDISKIDVQGIIREKDIEEFHGSASRQVPSTPEITWPSDIVPVVVYGAGRGALTIWEALELDEHMRVVCFVDDDSEHADSLADLPVYDSNQLQVLVDLGIRHLACEIADGGVRLRVLDTCHELNIQALTVVHPAAYVASSATVGYGTFVKAGAIIESFSAVGNGCIVDNGAVIPHDNRIEDGCHIAPGVTLGSGITVGAKSVIGIGVSIATGVTIGKYVIVSPGSSVTRDVPDYSVVEGVPGRIVGQRRVDRTS